MQLPRRAHFFSFLPLLLSGLQLSIFADEFLKLAAESQEMMLKRCIGKCHSAEGPQPDFDPCGCQASLTRGAAFS